MIDQPEHPERPDPAAIDRSRLTLGRMQDRDPDENHWLHATPEQRLAALEACREAFYGRDAVRAPMVRVIEVGRLLAHGAR